MRDFCINKLEKTGLNKKIYDFKNRIEKSLENNRPLILFGAGSRGISYQEVIRDLSTVEVLFCDNNPNKVGKFVNGISIISFQDLKENYGDCHIIITTIHYKEIKRQCIENNLAENLIEGLDCSLLRFGYKDYYNVIKDNEDQFAKAYDLLEDEYSRQVFMDRLNYCITGDSKYLIPLRSEKTQYFDRDIIHLSDREILVDGGAYTGDTVDDFLKITNGKFSKIYSFEPESTKHKEFEKKFSESPKIKLFPYGLWSKNDTLYFDSKDSSGSMISESGDLEIEVLSIDKILGDIPVTFIKMDIEGAELEALKGAKATMQKYEPKLAISVYHRPLDVAEIILYISKISKKYKFFLRHYSNEHSDTILYAIKK